MKAALLIALALAAPAGAARAQYWKAMGRGPVGSTDIQTLYGDSISGRLLAGGTFLHIMNDEDTVLAFGQAAWNGSRWDSLATRIQPYGGGEGAMPTYWFLRYQGQLYACGAFAFLGADSLWNNYLARLDETTNQWESLGCNLPNISGILQLVPKQPDTVLYATGFQGYDSTFCGFPAQCVFRYDGSAFQPWPPAALIPYDIDNYVGTVFGYKGKIYLTGSIRDPLDPEHIVTFLRWNGTAWEHVPGWNTQSPIKEILIHNDTLYVGGAFRFATNGPGNLVASFDGENWDDLGGGLLYPPVPIGATVYAMEWWRGDLLACGRFTQAGGDAQCTGIAKWDGHKWCSFAGTLLHASGGDAKLFDMAIWRDSLYVCGDFNTIDGDTIRQVAQWIGGDAVGDCSTVGIDEAVAHGPSLQITPLAEPGRWRVRLPGHGPWALEAFDALGRPVGSWQASGNEMLLDLTGRSQGLYLLRANSPTGGVRIAKVLEP